MRSASTEKRRLRNDPAGWRRWGPYLSERAWGTVREDYSEYGEAWDSSHRDHPFALQVRGMQVGMVDYEPAEATAGLFAGNSNWRGPIWFPVNYLAIESLRRFARYCGDDFTVEHPSGSGHEATLTEIADDLSARLVSIFLDDNGRRPVYGAAERFQSDPAWHGLIPFHEYFHGDSGAGLGASHQTGYSSGRRRHRPPPPREVAA